VEETSKAQFTSADSSTSTRNVTRIEMFRSEGWDDTHCDVCELVFDIGLRGNPLALIEISGFGRHHRQAIADA
jgi:hypothetical protein